VPGQVLGHRVHDDVGPNRQGSRDERGGGGVVDDDESAGGAGRGDERERSEHQLLNPRRDRPTLPPGRYHDGNPPAEADDLSMKDARPVTVVILVRHGRTAWTEPTRYAGDTDVPLDATGRAQAAALGEWAAGRGFTSLVCSDLGRAIATAAAVTARTGLAAVVDPRLREPHYGIAEGRSLAELRLTEPEALARYHADPVAHPWPKAEPPAAVAARGLAALVDVALRDPEGSPLVVAHSSLLRLTLCTALGIPLRDYRRALPRLDPATATEMDLRPDGTVGLLQYNAPITGPPA
jgi:probable phosphoglycerate mutase